jgi:hypothetical protein
MNYLRCCAAFGAFLAGCAPISQQQTIATPLGQTMTAGVGDVVLRIEERESMPNAIGGADIFGRTRPTGLATIQYGGLQDGKVVLWRSGIVTQSDATTMNSSGEAGEARRGTSYMPSGRSKQTSFNQPMIPIIADWKTTPSIPAFGKTIVIDDASPTALVYHIQS